MSSTTPVSCIARRDGRSYIEHNGRPYLFYAVALRVDDYIKTTGALEDWDRHAPAMESYFRKARELNFDSAIDFQGWSRFERTPDRYDFRFVDLVIEMADRYDLAMQLGWMGSRRCRRSDVPDYIRRDTATYPRHPEFPDELDQGCPALLAREEKALTALMQHIAQSDRRRRIMMFQVQNEVNNPGSWWADEARRRNVIRLMDRMGRIVNAGPAPMVTRQNFMGDYGLPPRDYESRIEALAAPGLDAIGPTVYSDRPEVILEDVRNFDVSGNLAHAAEAGGQFPSTLDSAAAALTEGYGYLVYELRTSRPKKDFDFGIYRYSRAADNIWEERDGTRTVLYNPLAFGSHRREGPEGRTGDIRRFNAMLAKAARRLAVLPAGRMAVFNVGRRPRADAVANPAGKSIGYRSAAGGLGIAAVLPEGLLLMSLEDGARFDLGACVPDRAAVTSGRFDPDGAWIVDGPRALEYGRIALRGGEAVLVGPPGTRAAVS